MEIYEGRKLSHYRGNKKIHAEKYCVGDERSKEEGPFEKPEDQG